MIWLVNEWSKSADLPSSRTHSVLLHSCMWQVKWPSLAYFQPQREVHLSHWIHLSKHNQVSCGKFAGYYLRLAKFIILQLKGRMLPVMLGISWIWAGWCKSINLHRHTHGRLPLQSVWFITDIQIFWTWKKGEQYHKLPASSKQNTDWKTESGFKVEI